MYKGGGLPGEEGGVGIRWLPEMVACMVSVVDLVAV